jgi:hypothetical protein
MRNVSRVGLDGTDQSLEVISEALIEARLSPIDPEVPVSRTLQKARILFKDSTGAADLVVSVKYQHARKTLQTCFRICATRRPADPVTR